MLNRSGARRVLPAVAWFAPCGPFLGRHLGPIVVTGAALVGVADAPRSIAAAALAQPAAEAALPDVSALVAQVRQGLKPDSELLRQYTFHERRQDVKVSKLGRVYLGPWREFEVYPSDVPGETYKRLVRVDGKPLPAAELDQRDAAHRQGVLDRLAQIERETPTARARRQARRARDLREEQEVIDDVFAVYDIRVIGRETVEGRPTLVTSLVPRPSVRTRSDAGKYLKKMRGRAWVNEADTQVVRVEMEAIEDLTFGLGLVGRMHKGSTVMFRRALVNHEIWLPAEARIKATGRAVIFRRFALETTTYFSDYRKFNITTTEDVTPVGR